MEYCNGKSGLIAISVRLNRCEALYGTNKAMQIAQWALYAPLTAFLLSPAYRPYSSAFGGMVAFCIIVGDTIPHVMTALFPELSEVPFLGLLTDRRAIIIIFTLGVSYPLSLYRDIAKVSFRSASIGFLVTNVAQLAKASTLALISMVVIITTVITQGVRVPPDLRGGLRGSLFVKEGVFQAIGVISFGRHCYGHNACFLC